MSQLVVVVSPGPHEVVEKGYFGVGKMPTDHENNAVHQNEYVQNSGQPEAVVGNCEKNESNHGWSDFKIPGEPIGGIYSRPDQRTKKNYKPEMFNVPFLISRQSGSIV